MPTSGTATSRSVHWAEFRGIDHVQPGKGESDRRAFPRRPGRCAPAGEVEREEAKTGGGEGHRQPTRTASPWMSASTASPVAELAATVAAAPSMLSIRLKAFHDPHHPHDGDEENLLGRCRRLSNRSHWPQHARGSDLRREADRDSEAERSSRVPNRPQGNDAEGEGGAR